MTARYAALDFGSNTVGVLYGEPTDGGVHTWGRESRFVRLAEGLSASGRLSDAAIERTLRWVDEIAESIAAQQVEHVRAVGTEAIRRAGNAEDLLVPVERRLGVPIETIGGDEEGRLTFAGVRQRYPEGSLAILDIGGGSTELAVGPGSSAESVWSLPIGAVNLTEEHGEDVDALAAAVESQRPSDVPRGIANELTVLGGTGWNLVTLDQDRADLTDEEIEGHPVAHQHLSPLRDRLRATPVAERVERWGIPAGRADVALAGFVLLDRFLRWLAIDAVRSTRLGLRNGVLSSMMATAREGRG